jgi:hypothetical protein
VRKQFLAILRILGHLLVINNFSLVRLQVMVKDAAIIKKHYLQSHQRKIINHRADA